MNTNMTKAQQTALKWFREHGGDGCFDKNGVIFAQGETAPVMRSTWNALEGLGYVQFYCGKRDGGKGYGRMRLTPEAR